MPTRLYYNGHFLLYIGSPSGSESAQSTILSLPVTTSIAAVIALIAGLTIGCFSGACFNHMCMRHKKPIPSQFDTVTQNMGAVNPSDKFLTINSAYGSNDSAANQNAIDMNGSTKVEKTPLYEDVEEVRKTHHENKNEFELIENKANCGAEEDTNITESFYDNDEYMKLSDAT